MKALSSLARPFLVAVICETEVEAIAAMLDRAAREGADAAELNLAQIEESAVPELRPIVAQSPIPVYTACRHAGFMRVYGIETPLRALTDRRRMERQIELLGASCGIDMELDTFAPEDAAPLDGLPGYPPDRLLRRIRARTEAAHR